MVGWGSGLGVCFVRFRDYMGLIVSLAIKTRLVPVLGLVILPDTVVLSRLILHHSLYTHRHPNIEVIHWSLL